ncbi:MAG: glutamate racemase [Bacteroidales bacterium]|nr:glutamate racemase [Bacteroidales bacterium]
MIGLFDSGTGGLSVLREIVKLLPDEKYVFFADNAHCPYGEKSPEFIRERCRVITRTLLAEGADIIVAACNTATAAAIRTLREEFPVRFIGMEPAVKPAALGTRSGVIGVLATAGTLKGSKYLATKGNFEDNCTIVEHVGRGFVELVERGVLTGPEAEATVRESLEPLLEAGADTVVLGCTHYPFLLETLQKVAGPGIRFIDPAPAVARHLIYVMVQERLLSEGEATRALAKVIELAEAEAMGKQRTAPARVPDVRLISSGDPLPLQRMFRLLYPAVQKTENK